VIPPGTVEAVFAVAGLIAKKISEETGAAESITYPIAIDVATKYVAAERQAVNDARARAKKRVSGT
jgi:hypothetical protein